MVMVADVADGADGVIKCSGTWLTRNMNLADGRAHKLAGCPNRPLAAEDTLSATIPGFSMA